MSKLANRLITAAASACLIVSTGAWAQSQSGGTSGGGTTTGGTSGGGTGTSGGGTGASGTGTSGAAGHSGAQASGQDNHQQMRQDLMKADSPDKLFLITTAVNNQKEIQFAQVAQQKSQNQQVKQVADTILRDHQQMAQQLQKVIDQQGLTTPQGMPGIAQQELQVLQSLSGDQFDQCFLSDVKAGHMATISKFEDEARIAKDPAVKQFASQQLPQLQQHAQLVQQAAVAAGLPSGTEAMPAGSRIQGSGGSSGGNTGGSGAGCSGGNTGGGAGGSSGGSTGGTSGGGTTR